MGPGSALQGPNGNTSRIWISFNFPKIGSSPSHSSKKRTAGGESEEAGPSTKRRDDPGHAPDASAVGSGGDSASGERRSTVQAEPGPSNRAHKVAASGPEPEDVVTAGPSSLSQEAPGHSCRSAVTPPDCDSTEASSPPTMVAERPVSLAVAMGLEMEEGCAVTSSTADDDDDAAALDSKANVIGSGEGRAAIDNSSSSRTSSLMQPLKVETADQRPEEAGSPQPGPSGLQRPHAGGTAPTGGGGGSSSALDAPDLQLDWLSSDTEESSPEDDVTVVRIARKKKSSSKDQHHQHQRRPQQVL